MVGDYIRRFEPERVLWINDLREITAGEIARLASAGDTGCLTGKNIALWAPDPLVFAQAFVALDGKAARVLLLPGTNIRRAPDFLNHFQPDVFLVDSVPEPLSETIKCPILPWNDVPPRESYETQTSCPTQWVIPTSGTTASPKLVAHTFHSLARTAKTNPETGRHYRWGQLYDMARFAGLQVFLNSLLSGSTLILTRPAEDLEERVRSLVEHRCNAISATPTLWRKILMTPAAAHLRPRQITLGGEIVDQNILNALRSQYPGARLSHVYASTEAGAAFTVNDGKAGFPVEFLRTNLRKGRRINVLEV